MPSEEEFARILTSLTQPRRQEEENKEEIARILMSLTRPLPQPHKKTLSSLARIGNFRFPEYIAHSHLGTGDTVLQTTLRYTLNNKWSIEYLELTVGGSTLELRRRNHDHLTLYFRMSPSSGRRPLYKHGVLPLMIQFLTKAFPKSLESQIFGRMVQGPVLKWLRRPYAKHNIKQAWGLGANLLIKI